jgi:hypothetical protein
MRISQAAFEKVLSDIAKGKGRQRCETCQDTGKVDQTLGVGLGVIVNEPWITCPDCNIDGSIDMSKQPNPPPFIQVGDGR